MRRILLAATLITSSLFTPAFAVEGCEKILSDYVFCGAGDWDRIPQADVPGLFVWRAGSSAAKLIVEPHEPGSAPEMDVIMDAVRQSVRGSFADPSVVTFRDEAVAGEGDRGLGSIIYDISTSNGVVRVHHSVMVTETLVMQYSTVTKDLSGKSASAIHKDFISGFRIQEAEIEA